MLLTHCVENTKPKHPKNGYCHKVYSNQQVWLLATHLFCGREGVALLPCEYRSTLRLEEATMSPGFRKCRAD